MKSALGQLAAKYDTLPQRERKLVAVALVGGVLLLGWTMFVDPARERLRIAELGISEQGFQIAAVKSQMSVLQSPRQNAEASARAELDRLTQQRREQNARLLSMEAALVPPQRMSGLLEDMLGRKSGLRLVSLRTLPMAPLADKKDGPEAARVARPASELYRHGVEIKLEGGYAELTDYLARLEAAPQKLLWNSVSLNAEKYPTLVLTLTVFTLSLDRAWLIV